MKLRVRVFLLAMLCLVCSSYFYWPNSSYQNVSFEELTSSITTKVFFSHPEEKCQKYFDTVRAVATSRASKSRYLNSKQIYNHIDHLRVFLKCHLDLKFKHTPDSTAMGRELLPMFSGKLPIMPEHDWSSFSKSSSYFWSRYLGMAKGRGIVISLGDGNTEFACRLLQVLHELDNALPIQFIHKGDVSSASIQKLKLAAKHKQVIDFMDVSPALTRGYSSVFRGYNNKWFAALFSTFEEIILMDADVVPFVKPESFFDFDGYVQTGAYFFRDRELSSTLSKEQINFFSKMIPKEDRIFNLNIEDSKLDNNFFKFRSKHVMESGIVVLHRRSHLSGLIISLALQYWFRSGRILYGDKDLYWLGQLISGNSNYYFNENAAAAIGQMEANNMICSTQIGHFNSDKKLLWTNGALSVCKRNTWLFDYLRYPRLRQKFNYSIFALRESYKHPVVINQAVIPAPLSSLNTQNSTTIKSNFAKDHSRGCDGIYYCASANNGGEIINMSQEESLAYNKIISVWNGPLASTP